MFRHLRMAAKGAAFGIRHLLEKVDENFTMAAPLENPAAFILPQITVAPYRAATSSSCSRSNSQFTEDTSALPL